MNRPHAVRIGATVLSLAVAFSACDDSRFRPPTPPVAEFLLAAGDSTYWIRSGPDGLRVRSAPILLTRADHHFYEVFITEDSRDYEEATFASARVYSRDVLQADSLLLFTDPTVAQEARQWERAHPRANAIDPTDLSADESPPTVVTDDIEVVDVLGPWLTFDFSIDVDVYGRTDHQHRRHRGVVDVRNGARASLASLFPSQSAELNQRARSALVSMVDSVRRSADERAATARQTLASFAFDSLSFGLSDIAHQPGIAFSVPGKGPDGSALSLLLPTMQANVPSWWSDIAETLPALSSDSTLLNWVRPTYRVSAHESADGAHFTISLIGSPRGRAAKREQRQWEIATVPAPAYQLISLDELSANSTTRAALARAFDAGPSLNGHAHRARFERRAPSARTPLRQAANRLSGRPILRRQ